MQGPSLRRPLVIGKAANGLYFLHSAGRSSPVSISKFVPVSNSIVCNVPSQVPYSTSHSVLSSSHCNSSVVANKNYVFWHQRLGHIPFARMKYIPFFIR